MTKTQFDALKHQDRVTWVRPHDPDQKVINGTVHRLNCILIRIVWDKPDSPILKFFRDDPELYRHIFPCP